MKSRRRLLSPGSARISPTPTLDFSLGKMLGENLRVGFKARNLLNPRDRRTHLFKGQHYDWNSFTRGRTYTLSLSYSI